MVEFKFETLEHRLRELAFLNSGVIITLRDERLKMMVMKRKRVLQYEGGIEAFVQYLDRSRTAVIPTISV